MELHKRQKVKITFVIVYSYFEFTQYKNRKEPAPEIFPRIDVWYHLIMCLESSLHFSV